MPLYQGTWTLWILVSLGFLEPIHLRSWGTTVFYHSQKFVNADSDSEIWSGARDCMFGGISLKFQSSGYTPDSFNHNLCWGIPGIGRFWSSPGDSNMQTCLGTIILHWIGFHERIHLTLSHSFWLDSPEQGSLNPGCTSEASEESLKITCTLVSPFPPS